MFWDGRRLPLGVLALVLSLFGPLKDIRGASENERA